MRLRMAGVGLKGLVWRVRASLLRFPRVSTGSGHFDGFGGDLCGLDIQGPGTT